MGKRIPMIIDGREFRTKGDAEEFVRSILNDPKYAPGATLDAEDFQFVRELLNRHPRVAEKIGCGIDHIEVRTNQSGNAREFYVVRTDGSGDSFSYPTAVRGTPADARAVFKEACRTAIEPQKHAFKEKYFSDHANGDGMVTCALSGERVSRDGSHVDHHPTGFNEIVTDFIAETGIDPASVDINGASGDDEWKKRFADEDLAKRFAAFHEEHASLQITTKRANLTKSRGGGIVIERED